MFCLCLILSVGFNARMDAPLPALLAHLYMLILRVGTWGIGVLLRPRAVVTLILGQFEKFNYENICNIAVFNFL